jgi:hypothetical protein
MQYEIATKPGRYEAQKITNTEKFQDDTDMHICTKKEYI